MGRWGEGGERDEGVLMGEGGGVALRARHWPPRRPPHLSPRQAARERCLRLAPYTSNGPPPRTRRIRGPEIRTTMLKDHKPIALEAGMEVGRGGEGLWAGPVLWIRAWGQGGGVWTCCGKAHRCGMGGATGPCGAMWWPCGGHAGPCGALAQWLNGGVGGHDGRSPIEGAMGPNKGLRPSTHTPPARSRWWPWTGSNKQKTLQNPQP